MYPVDDPPRGRLRRDRHAALPCPPRRLRHVRKDPRRRLEQNAGRKYGLHRAVRLSGSQALLQRISAGLPGRSIRRECRTERFPRRYPLQSQLRKRPAQHRYRLYHLHPGDADRPHPPRSGAVRAVAGLDAAHEVEGQGLPVLHERADRQADGRPARLVGPVLGVLRRDRGRPRRCAVRAGVRAGRREPG